MTSPGGVCISLEYDDRGNQKKITDPNSGICEYQYNGFNELVYQDFNDKISTLAYDGLGRVTTLTEPEGTTTFTYDTAPNGTGMISSISGPDSISLSYAYDNLSRLDSLTETIGQESFVESFEYDQYGRLSGLTFPSRLSMEYIYNNNGYLGEIKRESDQLSIWGANTMNARGQIEQYTYGNGLVNHRGFSHGYVTGNADRRCAGPALPVGFRYGQPAFKIGQPQWP